MNKIWLYRKDINNDAVWYTLCKVAGVDDPLVEKVYLIVEVSGVEANLDENTLPL